MIFLYVHCCNYQWYFWPLPPGHFSFLAEWNETIFLATRVASGPLSTTQTWHTLLSTEYHEYGWAYGCVFHFHPHVCVSLCLRRVIGTNSSLYVFLGHSNDLFDGPVAQTGKSRLAPYPISSSCDRSKWRDGRVYSFQFPCTGNLIIEHNVNCQSIYSFAVNISTNSSFFVSSFISTNHYLFVWEFFICH